MDIGNIQKGGATYGRHIDQKARNSSGSVFDEPTFILRGVYAKRAYVNNVATDDICGYTYECFNTKTFELIRVTVSQSKPLLLAMRLQTVWKMVHLSLWSLTKQW